MSGWLDAHFSRLPISFSASRFMRGSRDSAMFASDASGMLRAIIRSGRKKSANSDRSFPVRLFRGRFVTKSRVVCPLLELGLGALRSRSAPRTPLSPAAGDRGRIVGSSARFDSALVGAESGASFGEDGFDTRMIGHHSCWAAQKLDRIASQTHNDLRCGLQ